MMQGDNLTRGDRISGDLIAIVPVLALVCFSFVCIGSLLGTGYIDPLNYSAEHLLTERDVLWKNLVVTVLAVLALMGVLSVTRMERMDLRRVRIAGAVLILFVLVFGSVYVLSAKPEVSADSRFVVYMGEDIAKGNYALLTSQASYGYGYFDFFPFQFGVAEYFALLARIIGAGWYTAYALVNVVLLAVAYIALLWMIQLAFNRPAVTYASILLLTLLPQPILYTTLLYGSMPSFSVAAVGSLFVFLYLRKRKIVFLLLAIICIGLAVTLKPNAMIYAIALAILLLLDAIRAKRTIALAGGALILICSVLLPKLAASYAYHSAGAGPRYEEVPRINWLILGLSETEPGPGYYRDLPYDYHADDRAAVVEVMENDLKERLAFFAEQPAYTADFFARKLLCTWDEPTFQSVWVARQRKLYSQNASRQPGPFASAIFESSVDGGLFTCFRYQTQTLYVLLVAGLFVFVFGREKRSLTDRLLTNFFPLVLLGAFLYHAIMETKSQYVLLYLPLAVPLAANALVSTLAGLKRLMERKKGGNENKIVK